MTTQEENMINESKRLKAWKNYLITTFSPTQLYALDIVNEGLKYEQYHLLNQLPKHLKEWALRTHKLMHTIVKYNIEYKEKYELKHIKFMVDLVRNQTR